MYGFTRLKLDRREHGSRARTFAQMTDEKLLKTLEACVYMCTPCGPRQVHESHLIQRDLVGPDV